MSGRSDKSCLKHWPVTRGLGLFRSSHGSHPGEVWLGPDASQRRIARGRGPRHGVPLGMHRMNPEHLDSDPSDLSLRAGIRMREEPEDEEEEDEEEHDGAEEDEDGDEGYSE